MVAANQIVARIPQALRPTAWTEKMVEDLAVGECSVGLHHGALEPETIELDGMRWELTTVKLARSLPHVGHGSKHPLTHAVIHRRVQ